MTEVLQVDPDNPDPAAIARAADWLRRGGLVAFPTETVYGLGVNALDTIAVRRLFEAKQRPASDPLIVHIGSVDMMPALSSRVPVAARILAERFWPGPLTLVLPKSGRVPDEVTAGLPSVAMRLPSHPVARAIVEAAAVPIAAPSANLFSRPSPTLASHVVEDLDGRIDLVIDGGPTTIGVESTVVDLTGDIPTILRPGVITIETLREVLESVEPYPGGEPPAPEHVLPSPGMLEKHYSPRAELTLFEGAVTEILPRLISAATSALAGGKTVGIVAADEDRANLGSLAAMPRALLRTLGSQQDPQAIASTLYATLRELDAAGAEVIFVRDFGMRGLLAAVQDRLRRAAAGRIVRV